ncbi:MAG: isoleucine--tRNA ligase [Clostridia bacterium]|nr:isoleucine--tRNA ligase [Clostridia bacterium]
MYKKVSTSLDFVEREKETLEFWKENKIFEKSVEKSRGKEPYTFYDGPPTANGKPHIGHILTRAMKDIIPRYRTMKGYDVLRKAGWDTHGLPVELEVEKLLGLDGKEQIEEYGVMPFIDECKKSVWKYKAEWEQMSDRVGYWADMDDPYVTYHDNYIESEWWALKTIYDKGLLYKGHKIVPYCPRCGTALSSHEVAQGYKDVKETSATVRFKCADEDASYLAWTTTPWTLPSNVGLCVNENVTYCRVKHNGEVLILAKELIASVLGEEDITIVNEFSGSELVGRRYIPLFECTKTACGKKDGHRIVADDYVSTSDGTGIVHIAPAFGEDDARVGRNFDLPFVQLVDAAGNLCGGTPWDGMFVKDADKPILKELEETGKLFAALPFEHNYPFCWRCDTPLIYYARESWFIKMTAVREKLMEYNRRVNWIPESIKEGRMGNFLDNVIDWGLSRERYWGTPLPIWVCADCGEIHVVGSREELCTLAPDTPKDIELHKPFLDPITFKCEKCGGTMKREKAVIDCWFDSGSMPFAQWHYPFENKEAFERRYPANYISEAVDQTRGWFYTLLAISTCLFDDPAFLNCIVLGLVQDKDGLKMSKHKGNVVDPWTVLDKQGADAVRWYFYTGSMPWLPSRFSADAVSESQRKFMGTLWNTYAFYILYAEIDGFDPTKHELKKENLTIMDKWLLSRLYSLVASVDNNLDALKITEAGRELQRFTDDLSNWYVRRCRERFWGSEMTADKESAYMTLYTALKTMSLLSAPFTPFMAEAMYQNMVKSVDKEAPESVHLCDFPAVEESFIDKELEAHMDEALSIVVLGRSARNTANIKNRQPIGQMLVQGAKLPVEFVSIIAEELNVKSVEFITDAKEFISYRVKPQLKTLGPRYGKILPKINQYLAGNGIGDAVVSAINADGAYTFELEGSTVKLEKDDVLIDVTQKEGFVCESERDLAVVLNTTLTEELIEEGFVRELVSKIQTMRKEAGFEVTDHISISYSGSEKILAIFEKYGTVIASDTLAETVSKDTEADGYLKEWDINGEKATLSLKRV